jgi:hypothetical protein
MSEDKQKQLAKLVEEVGRLRAQKKEQVKDINDEIKAAEERRDALASEILTGQKRIEDIKA